MLIDTCYCVELEWDHSNNWLDRVEDSIHMAAVAQLKDQTIFVRGLLCLSVNRSVRLNGLASTDSHT